MPRPSPFALPTRQIGGVSLSPSRRIAVTVRTERGDPRPFVDVRLQVLAAGGWCSTPQAIALEADRLPELVVVLQSAAARTA